MNHPSAVLALREEEQRLLNEAEAYINARNPEEGASIRERFAALEALGAAISRFPSIRDAQIFRGEKWDEERLLESLCEFAPASHLLHRPTRIATTRGYLVAKCHALTMLSMFTRDTDFSEPLRRFIFTIVCALMAEEVYLSCLKDPLFPEKVKRELAGDLLSLWESGIDPRSVRHLPALEALWEAREGAPPSFGTMDGTSEIIRLTIDLGKDWEEFLVARGEDESARWALEEFLFGLSYEEIREVRARLRRFGILAVDHTEIRSYLGVKPAYTMAKNSDPRAIYDFYVDRRDTAAFRKRGSIPGPWKTLEEMYLRFRLTQD